MNAVLIGHKLIDTCLRACIAPPAAVHVLTDSACVVAAMKSERGRLAPYLGNRRAQVEEFCQTWTETYPETVFHATTHLPGHRNIADLGTRGLAKPSDITRGSEWQNGPSFLSSPLSDWPLSDPQDPSVPDEELLARHKVNVVKVRGELTMFLRIREIFEYSNCLYKCLAIVAKYLRANKVATSLPPETSPAA